MQAERLDDGRILAPLRAEGPSGEIGDALVPIGPDHPAFRIWDAWLPPLTREDATT